MPDTDLDALIRDIADMGSLFEAIRDDYTDPRQECREGREIAARAAASVAAVLDAMTRATPPGWKLVPETPTPDQLRAAASAFNEAPLHSLDGQTFTLSEWRAIISPFAAAPEAP